jgi:drug/metabolite transporter (DMT)-like permease
MRLFCANRESVLEPFDAISSCLKIPWRRACVRHSKEVRLKSTLTQPHAFLAYGCLALAMGLTGVYVGLSKELVSTFPVFLLAWLRFGIGGFAMLRWLPKPAQEPASSASTKRLLFVQSFFGNFLFSICMLFGVSMTSALAAGVIMASIPACVAVMSWLFLRERVGTRVWVSVACAVLGIALVSLSKSEHFAHETRRLNPGLASQKAWLGNLLVFFAVLCEAAYAVIGKKLTGRMGPKRISSLINLWGFLLVTPLGIWQALSFDFSMIPGNMWLLLVFYALAASVWSAWLWMTGLKTVPAAQAGVFTVMLPIAAAAVGVLILGEQMSGLQLLAFGIALVGVVLATLPKTNLNAA